ncbi:hypothetical protein Goari_015302 [Gossypium aridum]|uniref:Reverse transcriptase zinc-binding domain-containing protein n=1 Tax=Gossypium aridum TaxID=34290 RepID=A0A7J8XKH4_GOSAI|nr:hypothetical protein [Gossypium aridum]
MGRVNLACTNSILNLHKHRLVWRGDATGAYTFRSGYKRLLQGEDTSEPRHYNNGHTIFYKKLRQTNLPSKVKITIWRLFNNYITTVGFRDWLMDIVSAISTRKCRTVFCPPWVIWTTRKKKVHEGIKKSSHE